MSLCLIVITLRLAVPGSGDEQMTPTDIVRSQPRPRTLRTLRTPAAFSSLARPGPRGPGLVRGQDDAAPALQPPGESMKAGAREHGADNH